MQVRFILPLLVSGVMVGCGAAPKKAALECDPAQMTHAGRATDSHNRVVMSGAGDALKSGFWRQAQVVQPDCNGTKVNVAELDESTLKIVETSALTRDSGSNVRIDARVLFDFDSALLTNKGKFELNQLIENIGDMRLVEQILVIGHTDSIGSKSYNQMLSERRAESVRGYLAERLVDLRIVAEGRGEMEPVADNSTSDGRARNRRVEVIVDGSIEAAMRDDDFSLVEKYAEKVNQYAD